MREDPARSKIVEPGKAFAGSARRAERPMEFAQFYIKGRTPLVWDFVIDGAGGLSGIMLMKF